MAKLKELTIWIENKPGHWPLWPKLSDKGKVNILAFVTDEAEVQSQVRLVTDNSNQAAKTVTVSNCDSQKKRSWL
jgi:hypothetical protein